MTVENGVSWVKPITSGSVTGTQVLNITNSTIFKAFNNCTVYAKSSSTANSSWTNLGTFINDSLSFVNGTFDSTILEDSNDYSFNATCRNKSNDMAYGVITGVKVDNTIPQGASSLSPATNTVDTDGSVIFSGTVTGRNTTGCTLYFSGGNPGSPSYTMTYSGSDCTYTMTAIPEKIYNWYITASDGTNTTDSSTVTLNIDEQTSAGKSALQQEYQKQTQSQTGLSILGDGTSGISNTTIIVVALVIVLVIVIIAKRKKN